MPRILRVALWITYYGHWLPKKVPIQGSFSRANAHNDFGESLSGARILLAQRSEAKWKLAARP
jgi:hypothetical protein